MPFEHLWTLARHRHHIEGLLRDDSPYGAEIQLVVNGVPDVRNRQATRERALRLAVEARRRFLRSGWRDVGRTV
jgi:hypothetical protein